MKVENPTNSNAEMNTLNFGFARKRKTLHSPNHVMQSSGKRFLLDRILVTNPAHDKKGSNLYQNIVTLTQTGVLISEFRRDTSLPFLQRILDCTLEPVYHTLIVPTGNDPPCVPTHFRAQHIIIQNVPDGFA